MSLRFKISLALTLSLSSIVNAQDSLDAWFNEAKSFDHDYLAAKHQLNQATHAYDQATGQSLPHLTLSGQHSDLNITTHYQSDQATATITETLRPSNIYRQYAAGSKQHHASLGLQIAEQRLITELLKKYFKALYHANALKVAESSVLFWSEMYRLNSKKYEAGLVSKEFLLNTETAYQQAIVKKNLFHHQNLIAKQALERLIGRRIQHTIYLSKIDQWINNNHVIPLSEALLILPNTWLASQLTDHKEQFKHLWQAQQSERLPYLSVSAYHQDTQYYGDKGSLTNAHGLGAQVAIQWPLFSGGSQTAATSIAQDQYTQSKENESYHRYQLQQQLEALYSQRQVDMDTINAFNIAKQASQEALKIAQEKYSSDLVSISYVLDNQKEFDQVQLDLMGAKLNYLETALDIQFMLNSLDENTLSAYDFA
ncbi:MAG: TolC family protein [Candidatus Comchoanobacterales bacterium]